MVIRTQYIAMLTNGTSYIISCCIHYYCLNPPPSARLKCTYPPGKHIDVLLVTNAVLEWHIDSEVHPPSLPHVLQLATA